MAGTWQALDDQPNFCASTMLLLTDGSVLCQQQNGRQWWKLVPDHFGSYIHGSWQRVSSMRLPRMYYASAVLADGRVFVAGGEYSGGSDEVELDAAEMYDPVGDMWSDLTTPKGWTQMGDAASSMMTDGRILVGNLNHDNVAIFTPGPDNWSVAHDKTGGSAEESWVLLRDGSVLTVDCDSTQNAEKYLPGSDTWVSAGMTPDLLIELASSEIGPGVLLTDGRCFYCGATGKTALYSPPAHEAEPGSWTAGPVFPMSNGNAMGGKDAPGALLPNGNVLLAVAPVDGSRDNYLSPTSFFEFDGRMLNRVPDPPNNGGAPYFGRLLVIPSGQVLFSAGTPEIYAYTPDGEPSDEWRPSINECPESVTAGSTFTLTGQRLNGMSQASMYGDDATVATNYPIVRLTTTTGRVVFCRTSGHSTMAVATGATAVHTDVQVPAGIENGPAELVVVANGIASEPCSTTVVSGRSPARGRKSFRRIPSKPMAAPQSATATRGFWGTIGLGFRYISCGFYLACNWASQLKCTEYATTSYAQCAQQRDEGYNQCTQTRDNGYNQCTQTRDEGYNQCSQTRDEGYNECCTWWPCSWACDAWVWVSNVVCVAWTWISNVVCVAWTWISNVVCVAWTWIVSTLCKAFTWVMSKICP